MARFLILAGYFEVTMYLFLSGKLDQYINTRYTYLAYISMVLSLILAIVQLIIWVKSIKMHSHLRGKMARLMSPFILTFPILVALLVPTVTLDATTVAAKGYNFPLAAGASQEVADQEGSTIQYLKPDTSLFFTATAYQKEMQRSLNKYASLKEVNIRTDNYMEVMELIYLYPEVFLDKTITFTGFVYKEPQHEGYQFLFRFGIIHCIADSGVYGLLTKGAEHTYEDNAWLTLSGHITLEYNKQLEQTLPVLQVEEEKQVNQPDNPYVYRTF